MFERFTTQARSVAVRAQHEARELGHSAVGSEHVLLALLGERPSAGARVLDGFGLDLEEVRRLVAHRSRHGEAALGDEEAEALRTVGIDLDEIRHAAEEAFGPGALEAGMRPRGHLPFSRGAKTVLELSLREALLLGHAYVGTEHVLLGLMREGHGTGARILQDLGIAPGRVREAVSVEVERGGDRPGRTA